MKAESRNITAILLTFEPEDFTDKKKLSIEKLKEAVKTSYVYRINIPMEVYPAYYESEIYKALRDNIDKKTTVKFYILTEKMKGDKMEQVYYYFDSPTTSNY